MKPKPIPVAVDVLDRLIALHARIVQDASIVIPAEAVGYSLHLIMS